MIRAKVESDDGVAQANFDATAWFITAADEDIYELANCDWGGDYPADAVALDCEDHNHDVAAVIAYVERKYYADGDTGFECHVNEDDALTWLKEHRSSVYESLTSENG